MIYKVKYEDNTGVDDSIMEFATIEEAEKEIATQFDEVKEYFRGRDYSFGNFYHSGDMDSPSGLATEIWAVGDNEYARWIRLWENVDD